MASSLADLLFKDYRRKVLGLLLLRPDQSYHVREIARLTNTVPGTLHRELSQLAEAGILTKQVTGNQVSYQANRQCVIFDELAAILRKTTGIAEVLAQHLAPLATSIEVALVYGSIASGKATSGSDIDLLIIGNIGFSEAVNVLHAAEGELGREINPKIFTRDEWENARNQEVVFVREVMERPTINVIGDRDDLKQSAGLKPGNHHARSASYQTTSRVGGTKHH